MPNEMTDREIMLAILNEVRDLRQDVTTLQHDMQSVKKTCSLVDNNIAPKVQTLLENHSELVSKVSFANNEHERINALEFDVKVIKGILNNKIS